MALRTLQPAPDGFGKRPPEEEATGDIRKQRSIQACDECRRTKSKCSGTRPKCDMCITKNRECVYVGTSLQINREVSRLRVASLERLFSALRTGTSEETDRLLACIRATDDPVTAIDMFTSLGMSNIVISGSVLPLAEQSRSGEEQIDGSEGTPTMDIDSDSPALPNPRASGRHPVQDTQSTENALNEKPPAFAAPTGQLPESIRLFLPDPSLTKRAVESFFSCSGRVLHVFSREQMSQYYASVFGPEPSKPTEDISVEIGSLMAVSAVGAQSQPNEFGKEMEVQFYKLAKRFFEAVIAKPPFQTIKVCILLAHYSILDKDMTCLAYIDIGLGMARRHGLERALRSQYISDPEAIDLRRVWSALVFVSSWLSSTLGHISPAEIVSARDMPYMIGKTSSIDPTDEIIQSEMAKICLLKADILRLHPSFESLSVTAMETICKDLQNWYQLLPKSVHLDQCSRENVPIETKRSIFHMHLLHLGAIILLYRQSVTHFLQRYANYSSGQLADADLPATIVQQSASAALAADTSARIIQLFYTDLGLCKSWWLFIFQIYTTCTLLLHIAVQKKVHGYDPSTWGMEKRHAKGCISILATCGEPDSVALKFHKQLVEVYNKTFPQEPSRSPSPRPKDNDKRHTSQNTSYSLGEDSPRPFPIDPHYLLHLPTTTSAELIELSLTLLMMLSQPLGNPSNRSLTNIQLCKWPLGHPLFHEYPQVSMRLNWEPDALSFQWDVRKLYTSFSDLSLGPESNASIRTRRMSVPKN